MNRRIAKKINRSKIPEFKKPGLLLRIYIWFARAWGSFWGCRFIEPPALNGERRIKRQMKRFYTANQAEILKRR